MLSKACVVGAYQRKLEEIATFPNIELTVAVPPAWRDERGIMQLERAHTNGYHLVTLPMALNGSFHLHFYQGFEQLLHEIEPDIVHIDEEPYNLATLLANRKARRLGAKTLWFSWQNLRRLYPWPFSSIERYNLRHTDYAIVGSQTAKRVWRTKGYQGPLAVIPQFGVDPDIFSPPSASRENTPVHIAYVGRLVPEKGVDLLLDALQYLKGDWRATILGQGPEASRLQAHIHSPERVRMLEHIPSTDMPAFYREIDVLVLPSRSRPNWTEQFGRVLIEAMSCGVAVVGSETGEIPHVIEDAGLTFPENDVSALHRALEKLVQDKALRRTLGVRGRARVLEHFTQHQVAEATVNIYQELTT
jgi:glycosyltransferase involved in cell wall biosynthesis